MENCRLIGSQDTLFTGPLPEKEKEPGGFRGPKEFAPRINGRQYYKNTYICGGVDLFLEALLLTLKIVHLNHFQKAVAM